GAPAANGLFRPTPPVPRGSPLPGGDLGPFLACLGQADGDRLLGVGDLLPRPAALELALLELVHRLLDLLLGLGAVLPSHNSPSSFCVRKGRSPVRFRGSKRDPVFTWAITVPAPGSGRVRRARAAWLP